MEQKEKTSSEEEEQQIEYTNSKTKLIQHTSNSNESNHNSIFKILSSKKKRKPSRRPIKIVRKLLTSPKRRHRIQIRRDLGRHQRR